MMHAEEGSASEERQDATIVADFRSAKILPRASYFEMEISTRDPAPTRASQMDIFRDQAGSASSSCKVQGMTTWWIGD